MCRWQASSCHDIVGHGVCSLLFGSCDSASECIRCYEAASGYILQPSGRVVFLAMTTMPSRIMPKGVSSVFSTPCSLTIRTLRPMRQFLSMIAPSMCEPSPTPSGGLPLARWAAIVVGRFVEVGAHQDRVADRPRCGRCGSAGRSRCSRSPPRARSSSRRPPGCRGSWRRRSAWAARTGRASRSAPRPRPDRTARRAWPAPGSPRRTT